MAKVLVAVPTFENIAPETFKSIYDLDKGENEVDFDFVTGYDCAKARNEIGKRALEGYDYVLMLDSDMTIPEDALKNMLNPETDIVLGLCPHKNTKEHYTEIYKLGQDAFRDRYTYNDLPADARMYVRGGGLACSLIKTDVFRKMAFPWFKYIVYEDGDALSEDLYFCLNAREAGFKIEADTRVRCGHLARYFQYS